jgi:glycosyltransferase involved in cell wall biosynthesis
MSLSLENEMQKRGICVIIPTYNNQPFLTQVLDSVLQYTTSVIVVDDGSTDATQTVLAHYQSQITCLSYSPNKGKGYAFNRGFDKAEKLGFSYAITMDSDGQHLAEDLPLFVEAIKKNPEAMIIGSRALKQKNMPRKNTFANQFSNFWFTVQTGIKLPDTQTGFRLYPLARMRGMRTFTHRYEAELELLVRAAWKNIPLIPIPIQVYYPKENERITHFRPSIDFLRISMLNTLFVFGAVFYGYPSMFFHKFAQYKKSISKT